MTSIEDFFIQHVALSIPLLYGITTDCSSDLNNNYYYYELLTYEWKEVNKDKIINLETKAC